MPRNKTVIICTYLDKCVTDVNWMHNDATETLWVTSAVTTSRDEATTTGDDGSGGDGGEGGTSGAI